MKRKECILGWLAAAIVPVFGGCEKPVGVRGPDPAQRQDVQMLPDIVAAAPVKSVGGQAPTGPEATISVAFPLEDVKTLSTRAGAGNTFVRATYTAGGNRRTVRLPVAADTYLTKGRSSDSRGRSPSVVLRAGKYHVGLYRIDLSTLPRSSKIIGASFHTRVGWRERPGSARIAFHRMLADWSEEEGPASFRHGRDYEAQPFATFEVKDLPAGQGIEVKGLGEALKAWLEKTWENRGFAAFVSGEVMQVNLMSKDAKEKASVSIHIGPEEGAAQLSFNLGLLRSVLMRPADLRDARLLWPILGASGEDGQARITVRTKEGKDLTTLNYADCAAKGLIGIPGLTEALARALADGTDRLELQVALAAPSEDMSVELGTPRVRPHANRPSLEVSILKHVNEMLFDTNLKPTKGVYARAKGKHVFYGDKRLRLWGVTGFPKVNLSIPDRLRKMGFNAFRLWPPSRTIYTEESARRGELAPEGLEIYDRFYAECKRQGIFIMNPTLMCDRQLVVHAASADATWLDTGGDWKEWKEAVLSKSDGLRYGVYFDERLQTIRKRHASNFLKHLNTHTGTRYGEDEANVIWEHHNENLFLRWLPERGLDKWHPYFSSKLQEKWNGWLRTRYGDEGGLKRAWGELAEGESLASGTISLEPLHKNRSRYPRQRASDFMRFLIGLVVDYNRSFLAHCRTQAPEGIGVNVAPFSFDTQGIPNIPTQYANSLGEVQCMGIYSWTLSSALTKPPSHYIFDSLTTAEKPMVIYETNVGRPNPFRAEYVYRTAALGCWQDWTGVFWHIWDPPEQSREGTVHDEEYLLHRMPYIAPDHYWSCAHHQTDPVMNSAWAVGGRMFLRHAIAPAPAPVTYTVGAKTIFGYDGFHGVNQTRATFFRGSGIRFEPERDQGVSSDWKGPQGPIDEAVRSSEEILWDWPNERMIIDTPTAKAYVGKAAGLFRFRDGIVVGGFNTPFVAFGMVSADGRPMSGEGASKRILISAVADARNTGFAMKQTAPSQGGGHMHPALIGKMISSWGTAPVVCDDVGYRVWFPREVKGAFKGYDFALRKCVEKELAGTNQVSHEGKFLFMGLLEVRAHGRAAEVPRLEDSAVARKGASGSGREAAQVRGERVRKFSGVWNPMPRLSWGAGYHATHAYLRDGGFNFTNISKEDYSNRAEKSILFSETDVVHGTTANIQLDFKSGRMVRISVDFQRPPGLPELVAEYEKRFGRPLEKGLVSTLHETSRIRWKVEYPAARLEITISETQANAGIVYELVEK